MEEIKTNNVTNNPSKTDNLNEIMQNINVKKTDSSKKKSKKISLIFNYIVKHRFWITVISLLIFSIICFALVGYYGKYLFNPIPDAATTNPETYFSMSWWRMYFIMSVLFALIAIYMIFKKYWKGFKSLFKHKTKTKTEKSDK